MTSFLVLLVALSAALVAMLVMADSRAERVGPVAGLAEGNGTYLIVGTDSREDLPADLEGNFGEFEGSRTDVIMLTQVAKGARQILSLPRDLKVEIPGNGIDRINAAYELGGPDLLVETIAQETGIRPNHYVEVDFAGFAEIVDALGGIELHFPYAARDTKTGLETEAGTYQVDGATALAYARSRHYEELRNGSWVPRPGGDLERTARQREVLLEMIETASSPERLWRGPSALIEVSSNLIIDSDLTFVDMARFGWELVVADTTDAIALPVVVEDSGGVSYVVRDEPAASEVLAAFAERGPLPQ